MTTKTNTPGLLIAETFTLNAGHAALDAVLPDNVDALARRAYDDYFHKIRADVDFKRWRAIFAYAWRLLSEEQQGATVALDGVDAAVSTLEIALGVLGTNEPINRAAGNVEQADLERRNAAEISQALGILREAAALDSGCGSGKTDEADDDDGLSDRDLDDEEDDFDADAEFEATPEDDEGDVLDGDFKNHPFRGNQHVTASGESRTAVVASRKAKRAELKGDAKAQKKAHRAAYHAHMAASEDAAGTTRSYHRTMARFHKRRAGLGRSRRALDDASPDVAALRGQLAAAPGALAKLAIARQILDARRAAAAKPDEQDPKPGAGSEARPEAEAAPAGGDQSGAGAAGAGGDAAAAGAGAAGVEAAGVSAAAPGFRYAAMARPLTTAALPAGLAGYTVEPRPAAGQPHHDLAQFGILVSPRELTADELRQFDLAPLLDGDAVDVLAGKIAEGMREYASGYADMAASKPDQFRLTVRQAVKTAASGVTYSVGDPERLVVRVAELVERMAEETQPEPEPTTAAGGQRATDLTLLEQVAAGTHPDMLAPELADEIEAVLSRWPDDADVQAAGERAVTAYSNGLLAATA